MERVWIVSEKLYEGRDSFPQYSQAEVTLVKSLDQLREKLPKGERVILLGTLDQVQKAQREFPDLLTAALLPPEGNSDRLLFAIRSVLKDAKLQHELDAAENVAWSGGAGAFDDPTIEHLGTSILELSGARNMEAVEEAIRKAAMRVAPVAEVKVLAYPETASSRVMGLYQLAVPVQFHDTLKAHIYIRFAPEPETDQMEKVGEILLNLSDAVALSVERNLMLTKAEETKTVWEASFDSVEDPVAILDANYRVLRGNRAYGRFTGTPLKMLQGKPPSFITAAEIEAFPRDRSSEFEVQHEGRHYRSFFDPIPEPLGAGSFVLRFHDVTEERTLTEKILAKEQVAELGILVGSVAHEINNPIGGILAIGQILLKDLEAGTPLRADIENIVQSADRCRKIIQTMLSLVRKADEAKTDVTVAECLQSALDLLGAEVKRLQVKLKVQPQENAASLQTTGNRNRLLQVFFHLLQQSLLAIGERKARASFDAFLHISLIPGYGNLELRIEDNGDPVKHEYEIQSSVAFTVSKMILEEHEVAYFFTKLDGKNQQRLVFHVGENRG